MPAGPPPRPAGRSHGPESLDGRGERRAELERLAPRLDVPAVRPRVELEPLQDADRRIDRLERPRRVAGCPGGERRIALGELVRASATGSGFAARARRSSRSARGDGARPPPCRYHGAAGRRRRRGSRVLGVDDHVLSRHRDPVSSRRRNGLVLGADLGPVSHGRAPCRARPWARWRQSPVVERTLDEVPTEESVARPGCRTSPCSWSSYTTRGSGMASATFRAARARARRLPAAGRAAASGPPAPRLRWPAPWPPWLASAPDGYTVAPLSPGAGRDTRSAASRAGMPQANRVVSP